MESEVCNAGYGASPFSDDPNGNAKRFCTLYDDLRALAHRWLDGYPSHKTLQPTALVHEVFLRLASQRARAPRDGLSFRAVAVNAMRQVLVDYCRSQRAAKRGGKFRQVELTAIEEPSRLNRDVALFDLDEALTKLATLNERQSAIVNLRFLGGFTIPETAQVLGMSERTVKLDWQMARCWLARELGVS